jgi:hypothetical protein
MPIFASVQNSFPSIIRRLQFAVTVTLSKAFLYQIGICASAVAPLHGTATIPEVLELIDKIGPDYMYVTSDHFWDWEPPIPAQMYEYYGCLYDSGASYDDLYKISRHWKTLLKD